MLRARQGMGAAREHVRDAKPFTAWMLNRGGKGKVPPPLSRVREEAWLTVLHQQAGSRRDF